MIETAMAVEEVEEAEVDAEEAEVKDVVKGVVAEAMEDVAAEVDAEAEAKEDAEAEVVPSPVLGIPRVSLQIATRSITSLIGVGIMNANANERGLV